jgi:hypothetical protein
MYDSVCVILFKNFALEVSNFLVIYYEAAAATAAAAAAAAAAWCSAFFANLRSPHFYICASPIVDYFVFYLFK